MGRAEYVAHPELLQARERQDHERESGVSRHARAGPHAAELVPSCARTRTGGEVFGVCITVLIVDAGPGISVSRDLFHLHKVRAA